MIPLVRVDNRLLHGQILETWIPRLRIRSVVVADDDAASSPLARAAMTLCLPPELSADVRPVAAVDWPALASRPDAVLVLVRDVADLRRAVAAGLSPATGLVVNLGNVHFAPGRRPVTPSVFLSEEEVRAVEALAAGGFAVEARAIPSDAPVGPAEIARRYKAGR